MSFVLPTGIDRADGVTPLPTQPSGSMQPPQPQTVGTPSPPNSILQIGEGTQEDADSPELERAEQATVMHRVKATYQDAITYIQGLGRGTFTTDSFGNVFRILSSKIQAIRSGDGTTKWANLSYTAESISFDTPPDDYQMLPVELGLDIVKHPRYSWALLPLLNDDFTFTLVGNTKIFYADIKQTIMRIIQTYRDSPIYPSSDNVNGTFQSAILSQIANGKLQVSYPNSAFSSSKPVDPVTWDGVNPPPTENCPYFIILVPFNIADEFDPISIAMAAAREIISKIWRGEDTPYLVGFELTWTQYYFRPVYENPGGYIEDPVGIVPDYFISPSQDGSNTIFDQMAQINPQAYSDDGTTGGFTQISWLRKADEVVYQRTWFAVIRKWLGSPVGNFDPDLYTQNEGPSSAGDFNGNINPRA